MSVDPMGLVRLLYEGAIDSLLQARAFLKEGRIRERSAAISKAMQIILELQGSLDMERGGQIAQRLAQLYVYIQERLAEANGQQELPPLDEALKLLNVLYGGWKEVALETIAAKTFEQAAGRPSVGWTL